MTLQNIKMNLVDSFKYQELFLRVFQNYQKINDYDLILQNVENSFEARRYHVIITEICNQIIS